MYRIFTQSLPSENVHSKQNICSGAAIIAHVKPFVKWGGHYKIAQDGGIILRRNRDIGYCKEKVDVIQ